VVSEESYNETLRWPTNLDRAAIVQRLSHVREIAQARGLTEIAARFEGVEAMTGPQIGAGVIAALTWLQEKPEHRELATRLEMVAMNLKNLK
jgi:hypothetical protein